MKSIPILPILIFLLITNCSYNFSSDHDANITRPSTTNNTIILNNFKELDTINITSQIFYFLEGPGDQYRPDSQVYIDNKYIGANWNDEQGVFTLRPERYEDGIHTIKIEHSFYSGSGSLADQAGQEILTKIEEFKFVINRRSSTPPAIINTSIENGSITVKWEQKSNIDYDNAFLSIRFKKNEQRIPLTNELLNSGQFTDKTTVLFTGNWNTPYYDYHSKATYSILLTNEYTENYGTSKSIVYDPLWVTPKIIFKDFKQFKIKWSAHPMYENFENLEIRVGSIQAEYSESFQGSSKGGEYTINHPYVFGGKHITHLRPIDNNRTHEFYSFRDTELDENSFSQFNFNHLTSNGITFHLFNQKYYTIGYEDYVSQSEGYKLFIYEYSKNMELLQKKFITNCQYSNRYQSIYVNPITKNLYIDTHNSSYLIDKNNFSILEQEIGNQENGTRKTFRGKIAITHTDWFPTHTTIKNKETNNVLYSGNSITTTLSEDGTYIYIGDENGKAIYSFNGEQLSKLFDLDQNEYVSQLTVNENTLVYSYEGKFTIVNLITMNKKTLDFGTYQKSMQFDPISNKLLLINNGGAGIYDLSSEEFITFLYENNDGSGGTYFLYLQNGKLFHNKGIYVDIF